MDKASDANERRGSNKRTKQWCQALLIMILVALAAVGVVLVLRGPHWAAAKHKVTLGPQLVLVSIDGLRPDHISYRHTPHLALLADDGVMCSLRPAYPSLTFPNHYTMITGQLPAKHGIVGNIFLDPVRAEVFSSRSERCTGDGSWLMGGSEPVWNRLERDGGRAAVVHWPGAGTVYSGRGPTYSVPYRRKTPIDKVTDSLLQLIQKDGAKAPNMVIGYYSIIDSVSHRYGPGSPQERLALSQIDREIGRIVKRLKDASMSSNLVVLSDHGFASVHERIDLDSIIADYKSKVSLVACGATTFVYPRHQFLRGIVEEARNSAARLDGKIQVYTADSIPRRWKFENSTRIPQVIIQSRLGVSVRCDGHESNSMLEGRGDEYQPWGDHGYDPFVYREMNAVFIAKGPSFRADTMSLSDGTIASSPPSDSVDVYQVIAGCLDLPIGKSTDSSPALRARVFKKLAE